ncbi:uncharacterized protein LOC136035723 [Artemia franciscana]|uniref:uncharacterized protein LOC136035723 n=1 Tax=Artemia franciscana TaxID=6661 RepID=UPI0032DAF47B
MGIPIKIIYVSCIIGLALCAPLGTYDDSRTSPTVVPILKQINQVSNDGSYTFGYEAGDGSFKVETRDPLGNINGRYGFIDPEGNFKVVDYTAGNNAAFAAKADHIPVAMLPLPASSENSGAADLPFIPLMEITQAKKAIKLTNAEEDFSTDVDENGFPDALQNVIPNLKGASVAAPVADKAPVPTAVPMPQQQRIVPIYTVVRQISPSSSQSDPNTFIHQSPQEFPFSFVAPAQNAKLEQLNQARPQPKTAPQLAIGQFQSHSFQPQSFQFSPKFTSFN